MDGVERVHVSGSMMRFGIKTGMVGVKSHVIGHILWYVVVMNSVMIDCVALLEMWWMMLCYGMEH